MTDSRRLTAGEAAKLMAAIRLSSDPIALIQGYAFTSIEDAIEFSKRAIDEHLDREKK